MQAFSGPATRIILAHLFFIWSVQPTNAADLSLQAGQLRCEYQIDPLGIGETSPRLSWVLRSARRGDRQLAYQILVASSPDLLAKNQADLWDSGEVDSDENAHVTYSGKPLASNPVSRHKQLSIEYQLAGKTPAKRLPIGPGG